MTAVLSAIVLIVLILVPSLPIVASSQVKSSTKPSPIHEIPLAFESEPLGITIGPRGSIWLAENNSTNIVEYLPANQTIKTFPILMKTPSLIWFMFFDQNSDLWFSNQLQPYIWRFSPTTEQFANFSTGNQYVDPFGLAYDNFTNQIWFTSTYTDQFGYFDLHDGNATIGKLINETGASSEVPQFGPAGIQVGPQGNIFISQPFSESIVEYDPFIQQVINVWKLPGIQAAGTALDNAQGRVWFANDAGSLFGYVNQKTGRVTEFSDSLYESSGSNVSQPYWTSITQNGTVWFDEYAANKIARYVPGTGQLTEFATPRLSIPLRFAIDNQKQVVWFTEFSGYNLGQLDENAGCNCTVELSSRNLTLSSASVSFYLKYLPPGNHGLNSNSPPPLISGSFQADGYLTNNFTASSIVVNSSYYKITLTKGQDLESGNYSITVCPRATSGENASSPAPVRQCATSLLTVANQGTGVSRTSPDYLMVDAELLILVVVAFVASSIVYVRRRNNKLHSCKESISKGR